MIRNGRLYPGSVFRLRMVFTDADGVNVDPATVTFKTFDPCGRIVAYVYGTDSEVQNDGVGIYYADVTPNSAGRWCYRWVTTTPVFADEGDFIVIDSPFVDASPLDYT